LKRFGTLSDLRSKSGAFSIGRQRRALDANERDRSASVYFSQIRIDPATISAFICSSLRCWSRMTAAKISGRSSEKVHPDCHALPFSRHGAGAKPPKPEDKTSRETPVCQRLLLERWRSVSKFCRRQNWDHLSKIAGEFIESVRRFETVFRIAGGLQDNENWVGPSGVQSKSRFVTRIGPRLPAATASMFCSIQRSRHVYGESQGGKCTGSICATRAAALRPNQRRPRALPVHWNSPMVMSKHKPGVIYLGGNCVFKLTDRMENIP